MQPQSLTKNHRNIEFQPEAPVLKYHQESSNSCFQRSLASASHNIGDNRAVNALENCIELN